MKCLVHADQGPEPGMMIFLSHAQMRGDETLASVDREVDEEIDYSDEPESRRDDQDQDHGNRQMHAAMRKQRKKPSFPLILADCHPGRLQHKIGNDVLDGKQQHPADQRAYRDGRGHGGKRQADALNKIGSRDANGPEAFSATSSWLFQRNAIGVVLFYVYDISQRGLHHQGNQKKRYEPRIDGNNRKRQAVGSGLFAFHADADIIGEFLK